MSLLTSGRIEIEGRMPWSSNGTFLCQVTEGDDSCRAIYKPVKAERPLWDFPAGLYKREVAAYLLSEWLGWEMVPETVVRDDLPLGVGSLQLFVDADFSEHYFTLMESERYVPQLKRMAAFDVLANNADRKGGHCLLDSNHHIWGIDHGLCFGTGTRLRTVIWDWAGEEVAEEDLAAVGRLGAEGPPTGLCDLLETAEAEAVVHRARLLLSDGCLPHPEGDHWYPWPLV